jgi:hypothetical protein
LFDATEMAASDMEQSILFVKNISSLRQLMNSIMQGGRMMKENI